MATTTLMKSLLVLVRGPWFMVFASFLIMSAAGGGYVFAIYSTELKATLGYNQQTLNTLGFFKDIGANVGILSGLINEITPPWVVLSVGAAMNFTGYFMIYLALARRLPRPPPLWQMCLFIVVGSNSQTFAHTGALVTSVKNFPRSRGIILGLLKGYIGLSGAIFTQLYHALYGNNDPKSLVLLIAWLPAAVSVFFVHTVRIIEPRRRPNEFRVFCYFLYISLALAGFLMTVIIVQKTIPFSHAAYSVTAAVVLALLLLPIAVVAKEELLLASNQKIVLEDQPRVIVTTHVDQSKSRLENDHSLTLSANNQKEDSNNTTAATSTMMIDSTNQSSTTHNTAASTAVSRLIHGFKAPGIGEDYTIPQALVSVDMLVLFTATMCSVGGVLAALDNMGQIGQSLGYPSQSIGSFVSLLSIWNYLGRVTSGFASEILLSKYKFPRPLMLAIVLLLSCTGHLLIALGWPGTLYAASVIIGFCFGAQMPLLYAIISELFGLKYYSTLSNVLGLAVPISSYALNVRVAGYLYDREADKQSMGTSLTCIGVQCYRLAFLIITAVTVVGAAVMLVLTWRTWSFYRGDVYASYRKEMVGEEMGDASKGGEEKGKEETTM